MSDSVKQSSVDETSQVSKTKQQSYAVVADPQEVPVDVAPEYDAIICVGDILRFAPPPDNDPAGSLLATFTPEVKDLYAEQNIPGILAAIRSLRREPQVREAAACRYAAFFEQIDRDFYYIAGNQDIPGVLSSTAAAFGHIAPVSECTGCFGIDGLVPSFAGLPSNTFPGECSRNTFEEELTTADDPILVAHGLPKRFTPDINGFEEAITTTDGVTGTLRDGVCTVPAYRETGATAELTIKTDTGTPRINQIELPEC